MKGKAFFIICAVFLVSAFVLAGCSYRQRLSTNVLELQDQLNQGRKEIKTLKTARDEARMRAERAEEALQKARHPVMTKLSPGGALFPPEANPGECYARVFLPPEYKSHTDQLLKREAGERIEIIPAKFEWVEEKVLVKEASARMEEIPARYEWEEEKVMVEPAHRAWKKGRGLVEKVDHTTGEILCLVEVPAIYKTVKKRVLKAPVTTRLVEIPGEYKTIKVKKMLAPPQEKRIEIPAEYQAVSRTEKISEGRMEWRPVLCETNMTRKMNRLIQDALLKSGHDPGPIDGIIGRQTNAALRSFQKEKGLPVGGLTYGTIRSLGIKFSRAADIQ